MTEPDQHNQEPSLTWEDGIPVSRQYADPYYSRADGLAESKHTFLDGCGLPDAWASADHFTIAETGFGTGLNFLAVLKAFKLDNRPPKRLTFISLEGHPLKTADLERAHRNFPDIAEESSQLLAVYPPPEPGIHRRTLCDGRVELILLQGMAVDILPRLTTQVDAWFLDGFAPARNPDLWSESVLAHLARTSKFGTRLATFTAAGFVRRGLIAAGFTVEKAPGYGHKRERLIAVYRGASIAEPAPKPAAVTIIGAGIAGLSLGLRLRQMGRTVRILARPDSAKTTVPLPIIVPRLQLARDQAGPNFIALAYARSVQQEIIQPYIMGEKGGLLRIGGTADEARLRQMLETFDWGSDWLTTKDADIFFGKSLAIDSANLIAKLGADLDLETVEIEAIERCETGWILTHADGKSQHIDGDLVLATGASNAPKGAPNLHSRPVPGHVAWFDARHFQHLEDHAHVGDRYITPADPNRQARLIGATTEQHRAAEDPAADLLAHSASFHQVPKETPATELWHGVRATTADHLPMVGLWPSDENAAIQAYNTRQDYTETTTTSRLWIFAGFGSKGFQYSAHAADVLAEAMSPAPRLEEARTLRALAPIRFAARDFKRGLSGA